VTVYVFPPVPVIFNPENVAIPELAVAVVVPVRVAPTLTEAVTTV
jgi:hypothetical protein